MTEFPEYSHKIKRTIWGSYKWEVYHLGTLVIKGKDIGEEYAFNAIKATIVRDKQLAELSMRRVD